MADGKKKRSLREAFGVVRAPEEASAGDSTSEGAPAGPAGAPQGGKPAAVGEKKPAPRKKSRPNGDGSSGGSQTRRRTASRGTSSDPVITGNGSRTRSGGRGRAANADEGREENEKMVPGKGGRMVGAQTPVNMTFTVTARERYLWTLELKRRGLTAVGVLRETMEGMVGEENDG